jgi:hypothetical protein
VCGARDQTQGLYFIRKCSVNELYSQPLWGFWHVSLLSLCWPSTQYVACAGLELMILLPLFPECWDYRHEHLTWVKWLRLKDVLKSYCRELNWWGQMAHCRVAMEMSVNSCVTLYMVWTSSTHPCAFFPMPMCNLSPDCISLGHLDWDCSSVPLGYLLGIGTPSG